MQPRTAKAGRGPGQARREGREGRGKVVSISGGAGSSAPRLTGRRAWVLRLALAVLVPVAVLGLAEAVLRLVGYGYPTEFLLSLDGGQTLRANERYTWRFMPRATATRPVLLSLPVRKAPDAVRVFVLGESAAFGTPDASYGLARVLEVMLRERHPGVRFEVVNAAVMGTSSPIIAEVARDCTPHGPDVFVVYMGNNEAVGPWSPLVGPAAVTWSGSLVRGCLWARGLRLGQAVTRLWEGDAPAEPQTLETFLAHQMAPGDPRRATIRERFEANLEALCRTARAAGARLVVSTVAVNLRDCAPLASLHRPGLPAREREAWEAHVRAGEAAEGAGRPADARRHYEAALAVDDQFADLHYRLGRVSAAEGRWDEARRRYALARDLDALPFRADGGLNEAVRRSAAGREAEGVFLADAEGALAEAPEAEGGVPGHELFYDHVHLTFDGTYRLAEVVRPAVERSLPARVRGLAAGPAPSRDECARALALTEWDQWRLAEVMLKVTAKPPFPNQSDYAWQQERRRRQAEDLARRQRPAAAAEYDRIYQAAMARAPDDWRLHDNYAVLRFNCGDYASAAKHWEIVTKVFPEVPGWRALIGDALGRMGKAEAATPWFRGALARDPSCVEAHQGLALALVAQEDLDEAVGHFTEVLRRRPSPDGYWYVGTLLVERRRRDEGVEWLRRGAAHAPEDVRLRYALGEALLASGDAAAATHLAEAVRLDPHHVRARCALARALARRGDREGAIAEYRVALSLVPRLPEARRALEELLAAERVAGAAGEDAVLTGEESPMY